MRYFVLLILAAVALAGANGTLIGKKGGIGAAELVGSVVAKAIAIGLAHLKAGHELPIGLLHEGYHGVKVHHQNGIPYMGEHPLWRREAGAEPEDDDEDIVHIERRDADAEAEADADADAEADADADADAYADADADADAYADDDEAGPDDWAWKTGPPESED